MKVAGHDNGHWVLIVFNSLISLHAEGPAVTPCAGHSAGQPTPALGLQRCFQHITSRLSPSCLPSVNEQKGLTDLNPRCYTIFLFPITKMAARCAIHCATATTFPILTPKYWNRGRSDTIIQSQSSCDSTARVAPTCSLQEHSTSIISIWFIHHKHKLQFYYAGSNIKEFNTVLLETHIW